MLLVITHFSRMHCSLSSTVFAHNDAKKNCRTSMRATRVLVARLVWTLLDIHAAYESKGFSKHFRKDFQQYFRFFSSWATLGPLLGHSWAALGHSWAALGCSWATLGRSWGALGGSWAALAALLGRSWPLGVSWQLLGPLLAALGSLLAAHGDALRALSFEKA